MNGPKRYSRPLSDRANDWLLVLIEQEKPRSLRSDCLAIALMTLAIGYLDTKVGVFFSLQLLYLLPIVFAVAWSGWQLGVVVSVASFFLRYYGDFLKDAVYPHPYTAAWNRVVAMGLYFIIVWILHVLISLHRKLEQRVRERTSELERALIELRDLQIELSEIGRRERSAIGHELHDGLGQHLTATALAAELVAERLSGRQDPVAVDARSVVGLVQDAIAQTRQIARGLLLASVKSEELTAELEELASTAREQHHLDCQFLSEGTIHLHDNAVASQLFWIAQEAVRNALRHGKPSHVDISLESDRRWIVLTVTDDGVGLGAAGNTIPGIGLRIMANRAQMVGGDLAVEPVGGRGTRVRCRVPASEDSLV